MTSLTIAEELPPLAGAGGTGPGLAADNGYRARAPLRPVERRYLGDLLIFLCTIAQDAGVPEEDRSLWESFRRPEALSSVLDDPALYWCEGHVVAVGSAPGAEP